MYIPQGIYYIGIPQSKYLKDSVNHILITDLQNYEVLSKKPMTWSFFFLGSWHSFQ